VKNFLDALQKAAHETAAYMTFDVRQSARNHGWENHEANSLRVRYTDGKFGVHAEGDHSEAALTKEYGTEKNRPTAVMRKYGNHPGDSAKIFMKQFNRHVGGK
jgi:hypothetical protein